MVKLTDTTLPKARRHGLRVMGGAAAGAVALLVGCVVTPVDQTPFYYQGAPATTYPTYPSTVQGAVVYPDAAYAAPGYYYDTAPGYYYGSGGYYGPSVSLGIYGGGGGGGYHSGPAYRPGGPGYNRPGFDRPGFDRPGFDRPGFNRPGFNRPGAEQPSRPGERPPGAGGGYRPDRPGVNRPDASQPSRPSERPPGMGGYRPDRPSFNRPDAGQQRPSERPSGMGGGNDARPHSRPGRQDN